MKKVKNRIIVVMALALIVIGSQAFAYNLLSSELQVTLEEKAETDEKAADMRQKLEETTQKIMQLEKELDDMIVQNRELNQRIEVLSKNEIRIIRHASPSKPKVAITIDDGWHPLIVKKALEILQEKEAKATFFATGDMLLLNSQTIKEAVKYGIEMGNHTTTHAHLTSLDEQGISIEIKGWEKAMKEVLGRSYPAIFFRPPGMAGFTHSESPESSERFGRIIADHGYKVALWSVDTYSGIYKERGLDVSPQEVANYVIQNSRSGSIILLHFIEPDVRALPLIIDGLRQKGLELVTLSELIS